MKNLRTPVLCLSIMLVSTGSFAQTPAADRINEPDHNKPKLFNALPDYIPVSIENLSALLNKPVGEEISINLGGGQQFVFEGKIVSATSKYSNTIQSVVIRSTNFNGAVLSFSKIINADKSNSYTGRIVSLQHGDLFELKNENGQFILTKKNFYDLVNE
jgi:hypothetical protein